MSWVYRTFLCKSCGAEFQDLVKRDDPTTECKACQSTELELQLATGGHVCTTIVVDYPGSKRLKAGYGHEYNRPAEKKGRQVSMHGVKKP